MVLALKVEDSGNDVICAFIPAPRFVGVTESVSECHQSREVKRGVETGRTGGDCGE